MANLTDGMENEFLDALTGNTVLTTPTTTYLALFSADPTDAGLVTNELPSVSGYARKSLAGMFPLATGTGGSVANDVQIDFAIATGTWLTITHLGVMKAGVHGVADMMMWIALGTPVTIASGQTFTLYAGKLVLTGA